MRVFNRNYVLVALLLVLFLIACGTKKQESQNTTTTQQQVDSTAALATIDTVAVKDKNFQLTEEEKQMFLKTDNVLIPTPGELFKALNNLDTIDWSDVVSYNENVNYPDDYLRALNLGTRVANGFIAILARDGEKFGNMADVIDDFAHDLGVRESLLQKRDKLKKYANHEQWQKLYQFLDSLRTDVLNEIEELNEPDWATLAITGGWLEGLRIVSQVLNENYDEEASTLLYQPRLAAHLIDKINQMSEDTKKQPEVKLIAKQLEEIKRLCNVGPGKAVPPERVTQLFRISSQLIQSIEKKG